MRAQRYTFTLRFGATTRPLVRLQGSGGELGGGSAHNDDVGAHATIAARLLARARHELDTTGSVREVLRRGRTIVAIHPDEIISCRPEYDDVPLCYDCTGNHDHGNCEGGLCCEPDDCCYEAAGLPGDVH